MFQEHELSLYEIPSEVPTHGKCHLDESIGHSCENCNVTLSHMTFFILASDFILSYISGFLIFFTYIVVHLFNL
jgi:hypothetical protein